VSAMWPGPTLLEEHTIRPAFFQDVPRGLGAIPFLRHVRTDRLNRPAPLRAGENEAAAVFPGGSSILHATAGAGATASGGEHRADILAGAAPRRLVRVGEQTAGWATADAGIRLGLSKQRTTSQFRSTIAHDRGAESLSLRGQTHDGSAQLAGVSWPSLVERRRESTREGTLGAVASPSIADDFAVPYAGIIWALVADQKLPEARRLLASMPDHVQYTRMQRLVEPARVRRAAAAGVDRSADYVWLTAHREQYVNQWVAVVHGELVAAAPTLKVLVDLVSAENPAAAPLFHLVR
jgi:hypothetical protein